MYHTFLTIRMFFIDKESSMTFKTKVSIQDAVLFSLLHLIRGCLSCFLSVILSAKPPKITSQPTSQKDATPGKAVAFSVQATGTEPLGYQWQCKPFGKKGEKDGWQNLSSEGSTFQVRSVKMSNAGYYQCVVSNSAGSDTSQHASLTVGKHVPIVSASLSTHSQITVFSVLSP